MLSSLLRDAFNMLSLEKGFFSRNRWCIRGALITKQCNYTYGGNARSRRDGDSPSVYLWKVTEHSPCKCNLQCFTSHHRLPSSSLLYETVFHFIVSDQKDRRKSVEASFNKYISELLYLVCSSWIPPARNQGSRFVSTWSPSWERGHEGMSKRRNVSISPSARRPKCNRRRRRNIRFDFHHRFHRCTYGRTGGLVGADIAEAPRTEDDNWTKRKHVRHKYLREDYKIEPFNLFKRNMCINI